MEAGIDPALIEARCELGYVVTEDTRHVSSANEIAAWDEAVRRHAGDLDPDDDLDAAEAPKKNLPDMFQLVALAAKADQARVSAAGVGLDDRI